MTYSALWLPDAIRDMGVEPVEVDGWQTRGHGDVDPQVMVSHHTADGPNGATNSLGVVINGAPYTAPGPLANILQSREPGEGNDKAYIVAAGCTYNAGTGGWDGITGNAHTIGNEIEHTGTERLPQHRVETACKIAAGCLLAMGQSAGRHCQHWEWSYPPGSKIDVCCGDGPGGKVDAAAWRALTDSYMRGGPTPPPAPSRRRHGMQIIVGPRFGTVGNVARLYKDDLFLGEWTGMERDVFGMQIPSKALDFLAGTNVELIYVGTTDDPNVNDLKGKVMARLTDPAGTQPFEIHD